MAEIRLICPGCAAEYRVPDSAIPPEGREVECSSCGNVWQATPSRDHARPATVNLPHTADSPRLNRQLPDNVLDILRDEVEHERRARAAESDGKAAPEVPVAPPYPTPDPEWPATTITRHAELRPAALAEVAPRLLRPDQIQLVRHQPVPPASATDTPAAPSKQDSLTSRRHRGRGSYAAGLGLGLMLAGGVVALYLIAPTLADQGALGDGLMDFHAALDQARLWLRDQVDTVIR